MDKHLSELEKELVSAIKDVLQSLEYDRDDSEVPELLWNREIEVLQSALRKAGVK